MKAVLSTEEVIKKADSVIATELTLCNPDLVVAYRYAYNLLKDHLRNKKTRKKAGKNG